VTIDYDNCEAFGLDASRVKSIAARISKAAKEAEAMGLKVFGGAGSGTLRFFLGKYQGVETEVATLDGQWDGGDGGDNYR
jgi:hypothetical protein